MMHQRAMSCDSNEYNSSTYGGMPNANYSTLKQQQQRCYTPLHSEGRERASEAMRCATPDTPLSNVSNTLIRTRGLSTSSYSSNTLPTASRPSNDVGIYTSPSEPAASETVTALYGLLFALIGAALSIGQAVAPLQIQPAYNDVLAVYMYGMGCVSYIYLFAAVGYSPGHRDVRRSSHLYIAVLMCVFLVCCIAFTTVTEMQRYYKNCVGLTRIIHSVLRSIFSSLQAAVILIRGKNCLHSLPSVARVFAAHAIACDVYGWIGLLIDMIMDDKCRGGITLQTLTRLFYLPSSAYWIIAGATALTVWKNVGRTINERQDDVVPPSSELAFEWRNGPVGVVFGGITLLCSVAAVFFSIQFSNAMNPLIMLIIYNGQAILWLLIPCVLLPIAGCQFRRLKKQVRFRDRLHRPLLAITTLGVFIYSVISMGTILGPGVVVWTDIISIAQNCICCSETILQTVFLLDALRRAPKRYFSVPTGSERRLNTIPSNGFDRPSKSHILFLLLVNISLCVIFMNEAVNPQLFATHQMRFFGAKSWSILSSIFSPIVMLYRLISIFCFIDIWRFAV